MLVKCSHCKRRKPDYESKEFNFMCSLGKVDLTHAAEDFKTECDGYKSRYIEYPLTITAIEHPKDEAIIPGLRRNSVGSLVKVRPCGAKYQNKTYLGFYLGEADIGLIIVHHEDTGILNIDRHHNPAIFVPELKEIIYGNNSWWSIIKSEDELKEISDDTINNVWYVKALKAMEKEEVRNEYQDL